MTTLRDTNKVEMEEMRLKNPSSKLLTLTSSSAMTENIPFVFPADTGATGDILSTDGTGITSWGTVAQIDQRKFPPEPRDDYYRGLTNELINLSLLDNDIKGGDLETPTLDISFNSNTFPENGTLTTGATGGTFTYRSYPRFSGLDIFTYNIIDSSGVVSKVRANVYLSIEDYEPVAETGDPGPYLTYGRKSDSTVRLYKNGTVTTLFTATYPGYSGTTGATGTNCIAVNRDDNLVYYTAHWASEQDDTKIYAYDYANSGNNIQFLVGDFSNLATTFNGGGAIYNNGILYISADSAEGQNYLVVALDAYYITGGSTGNQENTSYSSTFSGAEGIAITSMAWDYHGGNLLITGIGNTNIPRTAIVDPQSGNVLRTYTYNSGTQETYISSSYNFVYYYARDGSSTLTDISMYNGQTFVTQPALGHTDLSDLGEWINELQPA